MHCGTPLQVVTNEVVGMCYDMRIGEHAAVHSCPEEHCKNSEGIAKAHPAYYNGRCDDKQRCRHAKPALWRATYACGMDTAGNGAAMPCF
ncbi:hypothetical protein SDC9_203514 [bioreactor metagenome]|uniref:Uncharacterized protein n=1 Tax=bioreactor metagenome TaxID=1076179 RepID=A0A645IY72_9ZZZZ